MSSPLLPEFFTLLGINVFLAISLLACLLDKHFPPAIPYIYQVAALVGFGYLLVSKEFMVVFGMEMRFWCCIVYLLVAVANVIAVNVYIAVVKRLSILALAFSGTVSFPTILLSLFFVSCYSNGVVLSVIPLEIVYVVFVLGAVLGVGIMASLKPGVFGKLGLRQPTKKVEKELTKALGGITERTVRNCEISKASKPALVTRKRIRPMPELLGKTKQMKKVMDE